MGFYNIFKQSRNVEYIFNNVVTLAKSHGYYVDRNMIYIINQAMDLVYKTTQRNGLDDESLLSFLDDRVVKKCMKYIRENPSFFAQQENSGIPSFLKPHNTTNASNNDIDQRYEEKLHEYGLQSQENKVSCERANIAFLSSSTPKHTVSKDKYIMDMDVLKNFLSLETSRLLGLQSSNPVFFDTIMMSVQNAVKKHIPGFVIDQSNNENDASSSEEAPTNPELSNLMDKYSHGGNKIEKNIRNDTTFVFSVDFRRDVIDYDSGKFIIKIPQHNIRSLIIKSCSLPNITELDLEPYLYIKIDELAGYNVDGTNVLGKIYKDTSNGSFVRYTSDIKYNGLPVNTRVLTISFLTYDLSPIDITIIRGLKSVKIARLSSNINRYSFITEVPHNVQVGEKIGIIMRQTGISTLLQHEVYKVSPNTIMIKANIPELLEDICLRRTVLKCALTFEINSIY